MLPEAHIVHRTPDRLRFKVTAYQGDPDAMAHLVQELAGYRKTVTVTASPTTGSVVVAGKAINTNTLRNYAQSRNLFEFAEPGVAPSQTVTAKISTAVQDLNGGIRQLTDGVWDLPGTIFVTLLTFGIIEIMRGNFRLPPWYNAFWYAFGLFTKSMLDQLNDKAADS